MTLDQGHPVISFTSVTSAKSLSTNMATFSGAGGWDLSIGILGNPIQPVLGWLFSASCTTAIEFSGWYRRSSNLVGCPYVWHWECRATDRV